MADVFSKEQRSEIMRKVKSNCNKSTELKLIAFLKLMESKVGEETTNFLASQILLFQKIKLPFSLMVVFGMDTIVEIQNLLSQ